MKWISVEDWMPEDDERVYIYDDGILMFASVLGYEETLGIRIVNRLNIKKSGDLRLDIYTTNGWEWGAIKNLSHWMPLPEPPKGE